MSDPTGSATPGTRPFPGEAPRVLIVEPDPGDEARLRALFGQLPQPIAEARWVARLSEALDAIAVFEPELLLLDLTLPDSAGLDALQAIHAQAPALPVVVMRDPDPEGAALAASAMQAGARDDLVKGRVDADTLARSIRHAIERSRWERLLQEADGRLFQAQKMEALGQLSAGVAHAFNELLTGILNHARLLLGEVPTESFARLDAEAVVALAEQAASLTRELFAFTRSEPLRAAPRVDLNAHLEAAAGMLRRLLGAEIEIRVELGTGGVASVALHPAHLEQIVVNLGSNARDAMPKGGPLVFRTRAVPAGEGPRSGRWSVLEIADEGHGVDPAIRARLFEPFFTTRGSGRSGLGLFSVQGIVARAGGWIDVESGVGEGCCFSLWFPSLDEEPPLQVRPPPEQLAGRGCETILMVDDEPQLLPVAARVLRLAGYTVLEASSPREALAVFQAQAGAIDLLLCDVVMPQMSGPELAEQVARINPVRTLFISGYVGQGMQRYGALPLDRLLEKPFVPEQLVARVRAVLDGPV